MGTTRLCQQDRTQRLTRRNTGLPDRAAITTLGAFRTFTNIPGPGVRTAYFAAFWPWPGVLPKNAESLRNSDALMRVAVPRRRGPAGLRDLFRFCRNRDLYIRRSWFSACARHGWYHYPQRALRAAETPDGRLQKRLTCRFLRSGGRSSPHDSYFLANTQNFLLAVPVANAFALWYDKFSKLKFSSSTSWVLSFSYRNPKFHFVVFAVHITFIVIFKVRFS